MGKKIQSNMLHQEKLRVLVGCESSGVVREAFRKLGHDAWSCDLIPADDGSEFHLQGDVLDFLDRDWDIGIFHPPCTDLAVSGARWFPAKIADGSQARSIDFFMACMNAPIPRVAVENPIGIMSTKFRKPDQIIQPHQFGDPAFKATCLWLRGLPLLIPTNQLPIPLKGTPDWKKWSAIHYASPGPDRWKIRSKTFQG